MLRNFNNHFLLSLIKILGDSQNDSKSILKAFELICREFDFECGAIYQFEKSNRYSIREQYGLDEEQQQKLKFVEGFSAKQQEKIYESKILHINKEEQNSPLQAKILETCNGKSATLIPIVDKNENIDGFILLFNVINENIFSLEDQESLLTILSLLSKCIRGCLNRKMSDCSWLTLEKILNTTGIDIYVNDFHTNDMLYVNKSMAKPYGGQEVFEGKKCWQVLFPGQEKPCGFCPKEKLIDEKGEPTGAYSWDYQRPFDGSWFRVFSAAFYWEDGNLAHVVSSADITENKKNEEMIEYLANYDSLTKLPNRRMLLNECARRIDNATNTESGYVLFFDIDCFKDINDTLGHDAGDEFLIMLGEFFSDIPLLKNSIYRNGGDEFVAIIGGETVTKTHISCLANFILERFNKPWKLQRGEIFSGTSIGIACYPEDGITAEELLYKADQAMYQVKQAGGSDFCFGYELKNK